MVTLRQSLPNQRSSGVDLASGTLSVGTLATTEAPEKETTIPRRDREKRPSPTPPPLPKPDPSSVPDGAPHVDPDKYLPTC
jgi:hypothetical protein